MSARDETTCARCGVPTHPQKAAKVEGAARYIARGLCFRCYKHHREGYSTVNQGWSEIADDYQMLRAEGYPLAVIAQRLGMSKAALDRALYRHRDDERAVRPRRTA